ncbi:beta-ketoacyl-[acyl-carrier-protein] synthase family protein [Streptomyces thermocarboxydus]
MAVTGIGVVAPGGIGATAFWDLLSAGRTATRGITLFDPAGLRSRIAAECDFDPFEHGLDADLCQHADRYIQFAVVAARRRSGSPGSTPGPRSVAHRGVAGQRGRRDHPAGARLRAGQRARPALDVDHTKADPKLHLAFSPSTLASTVAEEFGARGPVQTVSTGCTSDSTRSATPSTPWPRAGRTCASRGVGLTDLPITMACFDAIKATSPNNDDPEHASRPFDARRDGFVMGEGAAVLVLEDHEHARARGADILCEISGYATYGNAYHMTGLTSEGLEMARAIQSTLDQARLDPTRIDYVNAHGSGTRQNDRHETAAVKRSLGAHAYETPMSSIKSMVGHSLGAIGAIEVAACVLALRHQVVPPTANYETPDPECDLDYVPRTARPRKLEHVLSVGSGFGGFQSAVLLSGTGGRTR